MKAWFVAFLLTLFLIANLVVGFLKGRDVKTVRDFAIGNKTFGSVALFATLLATTVGGGAFYGFSQRLISIGIVAITGHILFAGVHILSAYFISNQVVRFGNCISFGDFIKQLYGNIAKCIVGFITGIFCIFEVALQIQIASSIAHDIFGINLFCSVVISTVIVSIYTAAGGMSSVVATDILQFAMIVLTLILLAYFTLGRVIFNPNAFASLPERLFSTEALSSKYFINRLSILFFINIVEVPEFQRLLMSKDRESAKKMYLYTAFGKILLVVFLVFIVFSAIILSEDKLAVKNPLNLIITRFIPPRIIPFVGFGLLSVVFSTGDSYLHAAGLSLSKDLLEPILKRNIKLIEVRLITFLSGFIAMSIVLWFNNLWKLTSLWYLEAPIFAVAIFYGFLGFKGSKRMFWYSVLFGFLGAFTSNYIPNLQTFKIIIGCFASLFAYFAVHLYENKGFKFVGNPIFPDRIKKQY